MSKLSFYWLLFNSNNVQNNWMPHDFFPNRFYDYMKRIWKGIFNAGVTDIKGYKG